MKYILYFLILFLVFVFYYLFVRIPIIAGYTAKCACTQYFENNRDINSIQSEDFDINVLKLANIQVDNQNKTLTSSVLGMRKRTAIYEAGLGCRLLQGEDNYHVTFTKKDTAENADSLVWPYGDYIPNTLPKNVNPQKLDAIEKAAFDADRKMIDKKTRSLIVVYKDTIIYEAYEDGFYSDTPQLGWSMTKSWMNTLVGMRIMEGKMSISDDHLFPHWTDERSDITMKQMLNMTTGIQWKEEYSSISDATEMLYMTEDIVSAANDNPLKYEPGTHWYYSSGTSNMISGILRNNFESMDEYLAYPYTAFFDKLGMDHSFMEVDESGNYIASSYGYASIRDWAKFGLLYLHDGVWNNVRLLPKGWIDFSTTEVASSNGKYGAHFWLNKRGVAFPDAPFDTYSANGYNGQKTIIIPSKNLVIVRTGLNSNFDFNHLIKTIINTIDNDN